jgi:hypothetical protein
MFFSPQIQQANSRIAIRHLLLQSPQHLWPLLNLLSPPLFPPPSFLRIQQALLPIIPPPPLLLRLLRTTATRQARARLVEAVRLVGSAYTARPGWAASANLDDLARHAGAGLVVDLQAGVRDVRGADVDSHRVAGAAGVLLLGLLAHLGRLGGRWISRCMSRSGCVCVRLDNCGKVERITDHTERGWVR